MTPVLQIGTHTVTPDELLPLLIRYQLLPQLLRELLIDQVVEGIKCSAEETEQALQQLCGANQITSRTYAPVSQIYDVFDNVLIAGESIEFWNTVHVWNIKKKELLGSFGGHSKGVDGASISLDKLVTISQESYKSSIVISCLKKKEMQYILHHALRTPTCVAFSPYGRVFTLGCLQGLAIWDAKLGQEICR